MVNHDLIAALADPDMEVQRAACAALAATDDPSATVGELVRLLPTAEGPQLLNAIKVLGELADSSSIPALLAALEHPNKMVRMRTIRSLGHFNTPQVTQALLHRLPLEEVIVQLTIVDCLRCERGSAPCYETLIRLLHDTPSSTLRYMIIRALGNLGERRAIEHIQLYLDDADHHVCEDAQVALAKLTAEH